MNFSGPSMNCGGNAVSCGGTFIIWDGTVFSFGTEGMNHYGTAANFCEAVTTYNKTQVKV